MLRTRVRLPLAVFVTATMCVGCVTKSGREDSPGVSSASNTSSMGGARVLRTFKGELAKDIGEYTKYDLDTLLAGASWSGAKNNNRKCRNCGAPTKVTIEAIDDARLVHSNNLPSHGVVIGRMSNEGNDVEDRYDLPPKHAGAVTYMILVPNPTSSDRRKAVIRLATVFEGGTTVWVSNSREPIGPCSDNDSPPSDSKAEFQSCEDKHPTGKSEGPTLTYDPERGPFWISCFEGCCSADAPAI
jgi:hypothetical protein